MKKYHPLAAPALILAAVFGGLAPIFGKFALRQFAPFFIVALRSIIAIFFFLPLLILKKEYKIERRDLFSLALISFLVTINVFAFIIALQHTTSVMSQLVYLLAPLIVLFISVIFLNEKFHFFQILGVFFGFLGAGVILIKTLSHQAEELVLSIGTFKSNFILLGAAFAWSLYLIFSKKASKKYSPIILTFYSNLTILFFSIFLILPEINNHLSALLSARWESLFGVLGLGLFNSVGMLFLYQWGIKHSTALTAASVVYINPFVAGILGIYFFGEKLSVPLLIGSGLIFLSTYLAVIYPVLKLRKKN